MKAGANMGEKENSILNILETHFPCLEGKGSLMGERRIFIQVPCEVFSDVLQYAASELSFYHLGTITGIDRGDSLRFIYHLANPEGVLLNLKLDAPRENPVIDTVTGIYTGAVFYERELEDLLGVKVKGLPEGRHYPLPENWPEGNYPLRKDWKSDTAPFK